MAGRLAFVVCALVTLALAAPAAAAVSEREQSLLEEINRVRGGLGLAPLRLDARLQRAAQAHSRAMLAGDYFSHGDFSARMRRFHARGPRLGENIAWGVGARGSPRAVVRGWLRSPPHRANLLRPGFRRLGLGVATGQFAGWPAATLVTADFAGR